MGTIDRRKSSAAHAAAAASSSAGLPAELHTPLPPQPLLLWKWTWISISVLIKVAFHHEDYEHSYCLSQSPFHVWISTDKPFLDCLYFYHYSTLLRTVVNCSHISDCFRISIGHFTCHFTHTSSWHSVIVILLFRQHISSGIINHPIILFFLSHSNSLFWRSRCTEILAIIQHSHLHFLCRQVSFF